MTKSLERLKRLAKRKGVKGSVIFQPEMQIDVWRYTLVYGQGMTEIFPLGKNAQTARFALNHMKEG